ncbi:MAG TPA: hypothetical protein VGS79_26140 [Puia sp.]|nr:hypothetical protein [Puia sp.]
MRELVKIDIAVKAEHAALLWPDDECYYLFDFYPGRRYGFNPENDFVKNLKRRVDRSAGLALKRKTLAMEDVAYLLRPALAALFDPATTTFVPVPPSLRHSSPHYDDRVAQLLRLACPASADIRELIVCREEREPAHFSEERPSATELFANYELGETDAAEPVRERIVVFDDVITSGNHFVACKRFLLGHFPGRQVVGVFVARRALA